MVHDLKTFAHVHAFLTHQLLNPDVMAAPPAPKPPGLDFGAAVGPQITLMDQKLATIPALADVSQRKDHRTALLEGQFLGDSLLDRFQAQDPGLATAFRTKIDDARREMILASIAMDGPAGFYIDLKKSLIERFRIYTLSQENAEHLANKCLADWLQQCPLKFITAA